MYQQFRLLWIKNLLNLNQGFRGLGLDRKGLYIILYLYNIIYITYPQIQTQNHNKMLKL